MSIEDADSRASYAKVMTKELQDLFICFVLRRPGMHMNAPRVSRFYVRSAAARNHVNVDPHHFSS
jgi:hypothetical protein